MDMRLHTSFRAAAPLAIAVAAAACTGIIGDGVEDGSAGPPGSDDDTLEGFSPLRRLTALQYERTVRDLIGVSVEGAAVLAGDERVGPFKSNVVAPVTELNVEQYMAVAETIAQAALADLGSLVTCDPDDIGELQCGDRFIDDFGTRALRRPLDADTREEFRQVFAQGRETSFEDGIRLVIQAALQSPYFLYHVEVTPSGDEAEGPEPVALTPHALAARLSYFLWRTMPDRDLSEAAERGELSTSAQIRVQVERMLEDPRAGFAVEQFIRAWLHIDDMRELAKDPDLFPEVDDALLESMAQDAARVGDYVVREGEGTLDALFTTPYSFAQGPLAEFYGIEPSDGEVPVVLDRDERAGLLTQPAFLAKAGHSDQSSPIHRGVVVREDFLCQPLPDPPPTVDDTPPEVDPDATTRERFAQLTSGPGCNGCHRLIDGVGFGFEAYDAVGAYREREGDLPVDVRGNVVGAEDATGEFEGAIELSAQLAASQITRRCVVNQWFRFALGRIESEADERDLASVYATFGEHADLRELIVAIAQSRPFTTRYPGR
ncbi:MAG: DUF1592 domain-containing protein [Myxococcota bacterium]